ncbi:hypothetical protein Cus16_2513 [Curtobacterium sp. ER1/6]|nr:hypothetical protein Cus16_2513 [Curtobacterium sp. ER1/6]
MSQGPFVAAEAVPTPNVVAKRLPVTRARAPSAAATVRRRRGDGLVVRMVRRFLPSVVAEMAVAGIDERCLND